MKLIKSILIMCTAMLLCGSGVEAAGVPIEDILTDYETIYLDCYEKERIQFDVLPVEASPEDVTFASLNESVATVDENGVVYGRRDGKTRIRLQSDVSNVIRYVTVVVNDNLYYSDNDIPVRSVDICEKDGTSIRNTVEIMKGESKKFYVNIYPLEANDKRITWKSEDRDIASVTDDGLVTAKEFGTTKIYATSRDTGKRDEITVKVIPFVRYPDKITIKPPEDAVFETGQTIRFIAELYPENTTEKNLHWRIFTSNASVDGNGNVTIKDEGPVTVTVYSDNFTAIAEYKFTAVYSENHFKQLEELHNVSPDRDILFEFDKEIFDYSANEAFFASTDPSGNGERQNLVVTTENNTVRVSAISGWKDGCWLFIKNTLKNTSDEKINGNYKIKINTR